MIVAQETVLWIRVQGYFQVKINLMITNISCFSFQAVSLLDYFNSGVRESTANKWEEKEKRKIKMAAKEKLNGMRKAKT